MNHPLLTGNLVRLRAPEPADIDILYEWENDPEVWDFSNTLIPFSRFEIETYVLTAGRDIFSTRQLRFMVDPVKEDISLASVGSIDLFDFDPVNQRAGIGILICKPYREKGYAIDALSVLVRYAFTKLPLHQLYCNISNENQASINLFEKAGFTKCGERKDWIRHNQGWSDELQFQLIRENSLHDDN